MAYVAVVVVVVGVIFKVPQTPEKDHLNSRAWKAGELITVASWEQLVMATVG